MSARQFFLLLLIIFTQPDLYSQKFTILKENSSAPAENIIIYRYNQAFFDYKIPVCNLNTGALEEVNGYLKETTCLYIDYGPYKAYFYAEPGISYQISLPETHNLSDTWKENPYFLPSQHHLKVMEIDSSYKNSELNEKIREFDSYFDPFADKQILRYYNTKFAEVKLDSFLQVHKIPDSHNSESYYQNYIFYKKGILEFNLKTRNLDKLTEKYFTNKEARFGNPAYRELFGLMFQSYYNFLADKKDYSEILYYLATKEYSQITDYLNDIELFNQEPISLNILLNEIYNAYYSENFKKASLLNILQTIIQTTSDPNILNTSKELEKSLTSLEISYPAPDFSLINIKAEEKSLLDFKAKYVYLGFCDTKSLSCLRELEYLKYIYSRFSQNLEILFCIIDEEESEIESFIEFHNIQWEVFSVEPKDKILLDYKIQATPVFYLIDKDGTLLKSPAPNPSENFEYIFTGILSSKKNYERMSKFDTLSTSMIEP